MTSKPQRSRQRQHAADTVESDSMAFADVVHAFTNRTLDPREWPPAATIYTWAALFGYSLLHPLEFLEWANEKTQFSETMRAAQCPEDQEDWWMDTKEKASYYAQLSRLFLFAPLRTPEDHARRAWNGSVPPRSRWQIRCWSAETPVPKGMVRVKWYPSAEAMRVWPEGLGELWVDLPQRPGGSVDLRPTMQLWGMENCYVLDGNRDEPHLLARQPTYELTGLAVNVLLGECHEVIGVVELPTPLMQDARRARVRAYEFLLSTPGLVWESAVSLGETFRDGVCETPDFVLCIIRTVFALLLMIITDSLVLIATKVLWPIIYPVVHGLLYIVQGVATQANRVNQAVLPWFVAVLEAAFLSDEELEARERAAGRRTDTEEDSDDSSDETCVEETV